MSHTLEDDPYCVVGYKNDPRSILVLLVVQPDDDVDVLRLAVAERRLPHGLTAGGQSYLPVPWRGDRWLMPEASARCAVHRLVLRMLFGCVDVLVWRLL